MKSNNLNLNGSLELTIDISVCSIVYIIFLEFTFPLFTYLLSISGLDLSIFPEYSLSINFFLIDNYYIPLLIPIIFLSLYELFIGKFSYKTKIIIKIIYLLF